MVEGEATSTSAWGEGSDCTSRPALPTVIPASFRIVIPACPTSSFPRKRESRRSVRTSVSQVWIPACAGMTMWKEPHHRSATDDVSSPPTTPGGERAERHPRHLYPPPQRRFPLPSQAPATNPPSANPPPSAPGVLSTPSPRDCEIMTSDWRGEIGVGGVSTPSGPVLPGTMGETILHPGSGDCPEGVAIRGAWSCGANSARPRTSTRSLRAAVKWLVEGRTWS